MQSSKIIISSLLLLSTFGAAFLPNFLQIPSSDSTEPISVVDYKFFQLNTSLDFSATSTVPAYLSLAISFTNSTTIIESTTVLTTEHSYSFNYYNTTFNVTAGFFITQTVISYFIVNKTMFQPSPFIVTHSLNQFLNKTEITFASTTELDLGSSTADGKTELLFQSKTDEGYLYNYTTLANKTPFHLEDVFTRSITQTLTYPTLQTNETRTNATELNFSFHYEITNVTTLSFTINATELSSASITLNSSTGSITHLSESLASVHQITFSNISFITYEVSITVLTADKSLTKFTTLAINDTSLPIVTKYAISSGLTTIKGNFSFSKPVKVDYYLTLPNSSIESIIGSSFVTQSNHIFTVAIGTYNLTLGITDQLSHHKQYDYPAITTQQLNGYSSLTFTVNQSVLTDQTPALDLYPSVNFNGTRVYLNDSVNITITSNSIVVQSNLLQLANSTLLLLNKPALSLLATSELVITMDLPLYHLKSQKTLQFVKPISQLNQSPRISLQSYVSNVSSGENIALHVVGSSLVSAQHAFLDIYSPNLHYSLMYTELVISAGVITSDFYLTIPQIALSYINLTARIVFDTGYYPTVSYLRLEIADSDATTPTADRIFGISNISQIILLSMNTSEPVTLEVFYGLDGNTYSSKTISSLYQSQFLVNLSAIMYQNKTNFYYLKLQDSNGHVRTYNNGSYYQVFIPKIDVQNPFNTTLFTVDTNGVITFQTNEDVTVKISCKDTTSSVLAYTCGEVTTLSNNFAIALQFPFIGLIYKIFQVVLTDKAGNMVTIATSLEYYYN